MNLKSLGNIEILKWFLAIHFAIYSFYGDELKDDPRAYDYIKLLKEITKNKMSGEELDALYYALLKEAQERGLSVLAPSRKLVYSDEFESWRKNMLQSPTYIREIYATNFLGEYDISYVDDEVIGFDYPVRAACKILNEKGYITYWSSANREDYLHRKDDVMQDKSVAYILIDHQNLPDDVKSLLLLDGACEFWGIALRHHDNGKYYGIWAEISSLDTLCEDISNDLASKALALPTLKNDVNRGM